MRNGMSALPENDIKCDMSALAWLEGGKSKSPSVQ